MTTQAARTVGGEQVAGVLLGMAVGDALGLPREGLSARRARRLFGGPPLRHRFLFGRGMVSDDTEHACMTGQALLRGAGNVDAFTRSLAWRLRLWLLGLPAGTGKATLQAALKLWVGFPPHRNGIYSAGNGPALRAPVLGACLGHDLERLWAHVRASTRLTHTDPRAQRGALLMALATYQAAVQGPSLSDPERFLQEVQAALPETDKELERLLGQLHEHLARKAPAAELVKAVGLRRGVSGFVYHSVPVALYCWLRHPEDFRQAVEEVIDLGGDTDSTAALVGGLGGAAVGAGGIPSDWLAGLFEWPRSETWMRRLAERLASSVAGQSREGPGPLSLFWPGLIPRNLLFLGVVLVHVVRRLLPPY